jgi:hypothetical protein
MVADHQGRQHQSRIGRFVTRSWSDASIAGRIFHKSRSAKFDGEFASHSSTYAGAGTVRYTW